MPLHKSKEVSCIGLSLNPSVDVESACCERNSSRVAPLSRLTVNVLWFREAAAHCGTQWQAEFKYDAGLISASEAMFTEFTSAGKFIFVVYQLFERGLALLLRFLGILTSNHVAATECPC
jgi:hypothetical protein